MCGGGGNGVERVWKIIKRWLFPSWWAVLLLAVAGAAGLYLVFGRGMEGTPLAYAVYLLSFYALVAVVGLAVRICRPAWRRLCAVPLVARWREDSYFRVRLSLRLSFLVDLCYAGMRIGYAVFYASVWDGALGFYYILLCVVRFYLIRRTPRDCGNTDRRRELLACRWAGWFLMGVNLALLWISLQIVRDGRGYDYPGTLIYAAAAYTFYSFTMAVINAVKYRRFHSPVLSAAKAVTLTCALVSVFSLETAMLTQFGGEEQFQFLMTSATAGAVCTLVMLIALFLVVSASRKLKRL